MYPELISRFALRPLPEDDFRKGYSNYTTEFKIECVRRYFSLPRASVRLLTLFHSRNQTLLRNNFNSFSPSPSTGSPSASGRPPRSRGRRRACRYGNPAGRSTPTRPPLLVLDSLKTKAGAIPKCSCIPLPRSRIPSTSTTSGEPGPWARRRPRSRRSKGRWLRRLRRPSVQEAEVLGAREAQVRRRGQEVVGRVVPVGNDLLFAEERKKGL